MKWIIGRMQTAHVKVAPFCKHRNPWLPPTSYSLLLLRSFFLQYFRGISWTLREIFWCVKIMPSVQVSVCMTTLSTIYTKDFSGIGILVEIYAKPTKQPMLLPAFVLVCGSLCVNYCVVVSRCFTWGASQQKQVICWDFFPQLFVVGFFSVANIFLAQVFPLLCRFPHVHSNSNSSLNPRICWH